MTQTTFIRLLHHDDKHAALADTVATLRHDQPAPHTYTVDPTSFAQVPGSPFAYWVSERIRRLFVELPPFEGDGRTVKQGLATADDFRFVRCWWEVSETSLCPSHAHPLNPEGAYCVLSDYRWFPFAKGGAYSPYYADIHLVVNWKKDGKEIRNFVDANGKLLSRPQNTDFSFYGGLTWSDRTTKQFSARAWTVGGIFSVKGSVGFFCGEEHKVLGLMNSCIFNTFLSFMVGAGDAAARSYQVGTIGSVPFPNLNNSDGERLGEIALTCVNLKRGLDTANETSHVFQLPAILQVKHTEVSEENEPQMHTDAHRFRTDVDPLMHTGVSEENEPQMHTDKHKCLQELIAAWQERVATTEEHLAQHQQEIDDIAYRLYGIVDEDRAAIEQSLALQATATEDDGDDEADGDDDVQKTAVDPAQECAALVSYLVGCVFGRWNVRYATGERQFAPLPDPFAPLPVYSPGMVQKMNPKENEPQMHTDAHRFRTGVEPQMHTGVSEEHEPQMHTDAHRFRTGVESEMDTDQYAYVWQTEVPGVLVDDPDHPDDIVQRVQSVLTTIWGERAPAIEQELCELLGVKALRDYFRKPGAGGFWQDHIKRYSKSRRKAPIYWLLQSAKKGYAMWVSYHHLHSDLIYQAQLAYVEPKIRLEEHRQQQMREQCDNAAGHQRKQLERHLEQQIAFINELYSFHDRLKRVTDLQLTPDLNDGVVLNIAPLYDVVPWKEAKKYWTELQAGKYAWSSISQQLQEKIS